MKLRILLVTLLLLPLFTDKAASQESRPAKTQENEDEVIAWIQQNAFPLQRIEPGDGYTDLQPLKQIWRDVKIVGLGETTHGTREFFQIKHRLLEFLVTEMGFNAFALEAGYAAVQPINEYVLHGKGNPATVLTDQGFVVWDTEEMLEMIEWLRTYNEGVPDTKKVRFYGLDILWSEFGEREVITYLEKVDPGSVPFTDSLFQAHVGETDQEKGLRLLQDLFDHLNEKRETLVAKSSLAEFDNALQYIRIMKQRRSFAGNATRSRSMFENLMYLVEHERSDAKFIVWAHNVHVGKGTEYKSPDDPKPGPYLGHYLKEKYGDQYYALGFEFYRGSYQQRVFPPNEAPGDFKQGTAPPAPAGSLPWYLHRADTGNMILDFGKSSDNPVVEQWLRTPMVMHFMSWAYQDPSEIYLTFTAKEQFDGILFIDTTTATHPTPNALNTVKNRKGI